MWVFYDKNKEMKVPIKIWTTERNDIEENCLEQAIELSKLPFLHKHVCLMPDTHAGMGMPIGGVIATKDFIIPNAVGSDIGCGMISSILDIDVASLSDTFIKNVLRQITKTIPTGFTHRTEGSSNFPILNDDRFVGTYFESPTEDTDPILFRESKNKKLQLSLATLGSGNHFVELQVVVEGELRGKLGIMIHSGSRNLGKQVNDFYHKRAKERMNNFYGFDYGELSGFPMDCDYGKQYYSEMSWALKFAFLNRVIMMELVCDIIKKELNMDYRSLSYCHIHHNYAAKENHFGKDVLVHRKGAIKVEEGEFGIIPGSMGTSSFIVKGKGNKESFNSASHGAGRRMGRRQAKETISLDSFKNYMIENNIQLMGAGYDKIVDESPFAYKNIDEVIKNEQDLIDVVYELKPLGVIKGE